MKKRVLIFLFCLCVILAAKAPEHFLEKKASVEDAVDGVSTLCNINNWSYWVFRNGMSAHAPNGAGGGLYPKEYSTQVIFQDGFLWGGYIDSDDDGIADQVRVGGQQYNIGTQAGWVNVGGDYEDGTFSVADIDDPSVRVYKIRKDYVLLTHEDLIQETAIRNQIYESEVTYSMTMEVLDQYVEDWYDWPGDRGAPFYDHDSDGIFTVGVDEPGYANADQVIWFAANDYSNGTTTSMFGSMPIGIEMQATIWAYDHQDSRLGQSIYKSFKLINRSNRTVKDMYVSQWSDPDIGYAADDLVGCDTLMDLAYAYNANERDNDFEAYDVIPPAMGYCLLQGPMIESQGDTAYFDLKPRYDHKNLGMTSFSLHLPYALVSDPALSDYNWSLIYYNFMRGYQRDEDLNNPKPWYIGNDNSNETTFFPLAGDPVSGSGDLDGQANWFDAGDRRLMLNSGPFDFAPGDTQEVIIAVLGGHDDNNLSSITDMRSNAEVSKKAYKYQFKNVPGAPISPVLRYRVYDNCVSLEWGSCRERVNMTELNSVIDYEFEGYNVYQIPNGDSEISDAYRIATFDVKNGIKVIYDTRYLEDHEDLEAIVPVAYGNDTGIRRYILIDKDYINDRPLYEGSKYYFAVTAYYQNINTERNGAKVYETPLVPIFAQLQEEPLGLKIRTYSGQSDFNILHSQGNSEATVSVVVVDPFAITGDDYAISFQYNVDSSRVNYSVKNLNRNEILCENIPVVYDVKVHGGTCIVEGMEIKVLSVSEGLKRIDELDQYDSFVDSSVSIVNGGWGSTWYYLTNPSNRVNLPFGERDFDRYELRGSDDIEIDFSDSSIAWQYDNDECLTEKVPFAIYRKQSGSEHKERLYIAVHDVGYRDSTIEMGMGLWDTTKYNHGYWTHQYEPIYAYVGESEYKPENEGSYIIANNIKSPPSSTKIGIVGNPHNYPILTEAIFRGIIDSRYPQGNKIRMQTYKPVTHLDEFTFSTAGYEPVSSDSLLYEAIDRINVFPNPYNRNNRLSDPDYPTEITFTHLPDYARIRIFNLSGVMVKTIMHYGGQFATWDRSNDSYIRVASGMYLVHIDMPGIGREKILKVMLVH